MMPYSSVDGGKPPAEKSPEGQFACLFIYILYGVALLILGIRWLWRSLWADLLGLGIDAWEIVGPFNIFLGILWLGGLILAIVCKKGAEPVMQEHLVDARKFGINSIISLVIIVLITPLVMEDSYALLFYSIWWIWYMSKAFWKFIRAMDPEG